MSLMNGNLIDGKAVAAQIREEITAQVADMKQKYNRVGECLDSVRDYQWTLNEDWQPTLMRCFIVA